MVEQRDGSAASVDERQQFLRRTARHADRLPHREVLRLPGHHPGDHARGCSRQLVESDVRCPMSTPDVVIGAFSVCWPRRARHF